MTDYHGIVAEDLTLSGKPLRHPFKLRGYWQWHCTSHETGEEVCFSLPGDWSTEALIDEARSQLSDQRVGNRD